MKMQSSQERLNLLDSLVTLGQAAIKAAMFINGGSAVALLAFVGQNWSTGLSISIGNYAICAIILFSLGLLLGAISTVTAYFAQLYHYRFHINTGMSTMPFSGKHVPDPEETKRWAEVTKAERIRAVAIALVVSSFVCFFIGVLQCIMLLSEYKVTS